MAGFWEIKKIADLGLAHLPVNSIMAIYVKTVQEVTDLRGLGWYLCDGTGGTPNLRGHFIMGGSPGGDVTGERVTASGTTADHQLTWDEMPYHSQAADQARSESGNDGSGIDYSGFSVFSDPAHSYGWGHDQRDAGRFTGSSETHKHSLDEVVPSHIQIGYFMYTGIPG